MQQKPTYSSVRAVPSDSYIARELVAAHPPQFPRARDRRFAHWLYSQIEYCDGKLEADVGLDGVDVGVNVFFSFEGWGARDGWSLKMLGRRIEGLVHGCSKAWGA